MFRPTIACIASIGLAAGTANAAFLSFGSDTADRAWTVTGSGANVTDGTGPTDYLTLHVDDNNGALPRIDVSTQFNAAITLNFVSSTPLPGGAFSHNYTASGNYTFIDVASGTTLFTVEFSNLLFNSRGGQGTWGTTGALQGDNSFGGVVTMTWNGANLPAYGLATGGIYNGGFGFDLTSINTSGALPYGGQNPGVALGAGSLPSSTWFAEGSWSASTVPAPGTLALLGVGLLAAGRRRRA
jgi:PEP-CTERM motif-containing protein